MIAFVVGSIYGLSTILALKHAFFSDEIADLYSTVSFTEDQVKRLVTNEHFSTVNYIEPQNKKNTVRFAKYINIFLSRKRYAKRLMIAKYYTDIFVPELYSQTLLYYGYARKNNPAIKLHLYDEGMSCYLDIWQNTDKSIERRVRFSLLAKMYFHLCNVSHIPIGRLMKQVENIYVNSKSLSEKYVPWNAIQIPLVNPANCYSAFFPNFDLSEYDKHSVIFLSSHISSSYSYTKEQMRLISITSDIFNSDLIIKRHPTLRDHIDASTQCSIDSRSFPIELLSTKVDLEHKIVITDFSTAIFSFYYLFEQKPFVIILYKLLRHGKNDAEIYSSIDDLVAVIKQKNEVGDRIFLPQSISEYKEVLLRLKRITGRAMYGEVDNSAQK